MKNKKFEAKWEKSESGDDSNNKFLKLQKRNKKVELQGEFRKVKTPTFDGEKEEDVEACLLNMTNYF